MENTKIKIILCGGGFVTLPKLKKNEIIEYQDLIGNWYKLQRDFIHKKFRPVALRTVNILNESSPCYLCVDDSKDESTLFTIETKFHTWYVDYNNETGKYNVHKDVHFRIQKNCLGDALEYIFETFGSTRLKLID